jgi:hypothetical protein
MEVVIDTYNKWIYTTTKMACTYFRNVDMHFIDVYINNLNLVYDIFLFAGVDKIVLDLRNPNDKFPASIYDQLIRFTKLYNTKTLSTSEYALLNKFFYCVRNEDACRRVDNLWKDVIKNTEIIDILENNDLLSIQYFLQNYHDIADQSYSALEDILRAFVKLKDTGALVYLVNEYHNELIKYINLGLVSVQKKIIENTLNRPINQSPNQQILDKCRRYNKIINILLE